MTTPASRRVWRWLAGVIVALIVVAVLVASVADETVRRHMEAELNASLTGYRAELPALDLNLFGFGVTLKGLKISQIAQPKPPVAEITRLAARVDWRALFHLRLVADFEIDEPKIHVARRQAEAEVDDKTDLEDKGWQRALEAIYPLKINRVEINDGQVTYVDDPQRPLRLRNLNVIAENIRNVRSAEGAYPSTLHVEASVFDSGKLEIDGRADFLSEPYSAVDADVLLKDVPLAALKPVAAHANLQVGGGILAANGHVEYGPKRRNIRLERVGIDGLHVDYVHSEQTKKAEEARVEKVKEAARDVSNEPATTVRVHELTLTKSELGYVLADDPGYRVFLSDADITVRDLSNQAEPTPAKVTVRGLFMGSGPAALSSTFRPVNKTPEFDLAMQIEHTPLTSMNALFRTYGDFDVVAGSFAFYSELHAHDGHLRGYLKPLFSDMDVYDPEQDCDKPLLNKIYESVVGGVATMLENPRDDVATNAEVSGRIDDPNVSTWQVAIGLIRNAFFTAVRPGLETKTHAKTG